MDNSTTPQAAAASPSQLFAPAFSIKCNSDWMRSTGSKLSPSSFKVYAALIARKRDNPTAHPSQPCLMEDTGLGATTVKRALRELRGVGLIEWQNRFIPTERGNKMRQTSNEYSFPQIASFYGPPSPAKTRPHRVSKKTRKTLKIEDFKKEQTDNLFVDEAISSPVHDETETCSHDAKDLENWEQMLVEARLSRKWAKHYARLIGPEVPRVLEWWSTVDKFAMRNLGLLVNHLKEPSLVPEKPAAPTHEPDFQNAPSKDLHGAAAQPAVRLSKSELQERAKKRIAACLAQFAPAARGKLEIGMDNMSLKAKEDYLNWTQSKEWSVACQLVDEESPGAESVSR